MKNTSRTMIIVFIFFVAAGLLSACASGNWRRRLQPTIVNSPVLPAETQSNDQPGRIPPSTTTESQISGGEDNQVTDNQPSVVPEPTSTPSASINPADDTNGNNLENRLEQLNSANQNADGLNDMD
jgi:hypothetical protein